MNTKTNRFDQLATSVLGAPLYAVLVMQRRAHKVDTQVEVVGDDFGGEVYRRLADAKSAARMRVRNAVESRRRCGDETAQASKDEMSFTAEHNLYRCEVAVVEIKPIDDNGKRTN